MISVVVAVAFSSALLGVSAINGDAVMPSCADAKAVISALIDDAKHEWQYPARADIVLIETSPDILKKQASAGTRDRNDVDLFWKSWSKSTDNNRPTYALINAWKHSSLKSPFDCFQTRQIDGLRLVSAADARQISREFAGHNTEVLNTKSLSANEAKARLVTIAYGMPVLSTDKNEALISYSETCGVICGSAGFYLMAKQNDGRWVIKATRAVLVF